MYINNEILIGASPDKVWKVLTDPTETVKYMYACLAVSDWQVGSSLNWVMQHNGDEVNVVEGNILASTNPNLETVIIEIIAVKGKILAIEPHKHITYTVIDPHNAAIPDLPENYLTVTYDLIPEGEHTRFAVSQGDYTGMIEGEKRYNDAVSAGGWSSILEKIKAQAEAL